MFQLTLAAISQGGTASIPFMIPTQLEEMWISNSFLNAPLGKQLKASAEVAVRGLRDVDCSFVALDHSTGDELIIGKHYNATALTTLDVAQEEPQKRRLGYLMR